MILRPPRATRTDPLFPYTTLFRSTWSIDVSEVPSAADRETLEAEIAAFMQQRIEDGNLSAEDIPLRLARYGLMAPERSEEHTSELQSLMRLSYAVFCLKKKTRLTSPTNTVQQL